MKTHLFKIIGLFILLQFLGVQNINSQDQKLKAKYKSWLVTYPEKILNDSVSIDNLPYAYQNMYRYQITKGYLYQLKDSTINFAYSLNPSDPVFSKEFNIKNIESIKARRKGKIGIGVLIGSVSGLVLGGIIGAALHKDCDDSSSISCVLEESTAAVGNFISGGLIGAVVGAGIGAAVGSIKVNVPINGNQSKYEDQKIKLQKYLIR